MFFEHLETRRMFATTIVNTSVVAAKIPQVVVSMPLVAPKPSLVSQVGSVLQGTPDPSRLGGAGATLLPGGVQVSLNPAQRPALGDFAAGDLRSLLGNSVLRELIARFEKSPRQLTDLTDSANSAGGGDELIDIVGADLGAMRSIFDYARGDRTSQASQGNAQAELDRILADALLKRRVGTNGDEHLDKGDGSEDADTEDAIADEDNVATDTDDDSDGERGLIDAIVDLFTWLSGGSEDSKTYPSSASRGTPDPNSDDVSLTPQQQQAIDQLWALASKYVTNPPRALDQGTGLISQPPDENGGLQKPDRDQLPGAGAIRTSGLAPYINPGSGDDGGGAILLSGGTEMPRLVATVKDPPKPDSGTSTNVPDRSPVGGVPGGGTPSNPDSGN